MTQPKQRSVSTLDMWSAPKPSPSSKRVTATSTGISRVQPYLTLTLSPLSSLQSNFGVVPEMSDGRNVQVVSFELINGAFGSLEKSTARASNLEDVPSRKIRAPASVA